MKTESAHCFLKARAALLLFLPLLAPFDASGQAGGSTANTGYITFIIEKAEQMEREEVNPNIEKWAEGKNINPWDRGTVEKKMNFKIAKRLMKIYMGKPREAPVGGTPGECGVPVGLPHRCECPWPLSLDPMYHTYWMYYMPVAIIEGSEVAFRTAFENKQNIKKLLMQAVQDHYKMAMPVQIQVNQKINQQAQKNRWAYEVSESVDQSPQPDREEDRFRSYKPGSFISMFPHIFNTGDPDDNIDDFHEENKAENWQWWIHRGAQAPSLSAAGLRKPPVPKMLNEGTRWNDVGQTMGDKPKYEPITYMYHNYPTYEDKELKDRALDRYSKETYRDKKHYDRNAGHTPRDILPEKIRFDLDQKGSEQKGLLPGNLAGQGPFTGMIYQTLYGPTAGLVAIHRALVIATEKFPSGEHDPSALYHPYRYEGDTNLWSPSPRSKFQWLAEIYNQDLPKGCFKWEGEDQFIPNWWGPQARDANLNKTKNHNYTFGAVIWNPMRGCHAPCVPNPFNPPPLPEIVS